MSTIAQLKKRAGEYEQKKQFDKALSVYMQILEELEGRVEEADVVLYNRVGDLLLREGNAAEAISFYERAVTLYAEGGFFNNAIALCNKIRRHAPDRSSVYYKLGQISARKGFVTDARQYFLEYADRMQRAGDLDEAFRSLKEFAELCPDQDDIRLMLADRLVRGNRKTEAIEQLQSLYDKFMADGRASEARATAERMTAIDPNVVPRRTPGSPTTRTTDLVFLDLGFDDSPSADEVSSETTSPSVQLDDQAPPPPGRRTPVPDLPMPELEGAADALFSPGSVADQMPAELDELAQASTAMEAAVDGLQPDRFSDRSGVEPEMLPLDIEPISLDASALPAEDLDRGEDVGNGGELSTADPLPELYDVQPHHTSFLNTGEEGPEIPDVDIPEPDSPPLQFLDVDYDLNGSPGDGKESEESLAADAFAVDERDLSAMALINELQPEQRVSPHAASEVIELQLEQTAFLPADSGVAGNVAEPDVAAAAPLLVDEAVHAATAGVSEQGPTLTPTSVRAAQEYDARARELEEAMCAAERAHNFAAASDIAVRLLELEPNGVRLHQKRVEYAFRANDTARLVSAYLALAGCLFRDEQLDKARAVYLRVIELAPENEEARHALDTLLEPAAIGGMDADASTLSELSASPAAPAGAWATLSPNAEPAPGPALVDDNAAMDEAGEFVNLADWLREDEANRTTRMVVGVQEPADDDQVDFAEMLSMFKQGVAANVDEADYSSHYDLGIAYKEMGLLDEAIAQFQKALRGPEQRVRTYEALGQCFIDKRQFPIAITILSRALGEGTYTDDVLVGVLYLLGHASEALGRWGEARAYYERVFAVDIQFRDVGERLAAAERALQ